MVSRIFLPPPQEENPFNGIERSHDFLELLGYSLENPFNGIERPLLGVFFMSVMLKNPFNGIESSPATPSPPPGWDGLGIHSMELKEQPLPWQPTPPRRNVNPFNGIESLARQGL